MQTRLKKLRKEVGVTPCEIALYVITKTVLEKDEEDQENE